MGRPYPPTGGVSLSLSFQVAGRDRKVRRTRRAVGLRLHEFDDGGRDSSNDVRLQDGRLPVAARLVSAGQGAPPRRPTHGGTFPASTTGNAARVMLIVRLGSWY